MSGSLAGNPSERLATMTFGRDRKPVCVKKSFSAPHLQTVCPRMLLGDLEFGLEPRQFAGWPG